MIKSIVSRVIGTRFEREMKKLQPIVDEILENEARLSSLSEEELQAQTDKFRAIIRERTEEIEAEIERLRDERRHTEDAASREKLTFRITEAEDELTAATDEILDEILPEVFATVREACRRMLGREIVVTGNNMTWEMVPYDVQLIGGIVLHQGKIAEMATGEGKTLVATLPLYLNALPGKGSHLVTVNNYLAGRRSAEPPIERISRMARTTSSASTTCATTWWCVSVTGCSVATTTRSSMRWTRFSSTRLARRSSSAVRLATPMTNRSTRSTTRR